MLLAYQTYCLCGTRDQHHPITSEDESFQAPHSLEEHQGFPELKYSQVEDLTSSLKHHSWATASF